MLTRLLAVVALVAAALVGGWLFLDPGSSDFEGSWVLTSLTHGDEPVELIDTHPVTLVIDHSEATGISACNHYRAEFTRHGEDVEFTNTFSSAAACAEPAVMELENAFIQALGAVRRADRDGDTLTLTGDGVTLVLQAGVAP